MTPEEKNLIRVSFQRVMAEPNALAETFYRRLFALAPDTRPLFQCDMREQGHKFTAMMQTALECLNPLDAVVPTLWQMGKRHGGYGVQSEHYESVRAALMGAMKELNGAAFTPETEAAWSELYDIMAATMEQAASEGSIERPQSGSIKARKPGHTEPRK